MSTDRTFNPTVPSLAGVPYRIGQIVPRDRIECIRVRYLTVATEQIAKECRLMLSSGQAQFSDLVRSLSLDQLTRENDGLTNWISVRDDYGDSGDIRWSQVGVDILNTSAPLIKPFTGHEEASSPYPPEIINKAMYLGKGDIAVLPSSDSLRFHVVQLADVQSRLSPQLTKRRNERFLELIDFQGNGSEMTYQIDTMGCQMNVADSERMEGQLVELGFKRISDKIHDEGANRTQKMLSVEALPSVVIVNTCSIRDHAEQKVYSYLGQHAQRKRKGGNVCIVVAGCVAQQEGENLLRRFPEIDIVMGPQYAPYFTELLMKAAEGNQVCATDPLHQSEAQQANNFALRRSDTTAFVNVIYGCNERCTYCVVPSTRGVEQSRTKEAILTEIVSLVAQGFREVTLLGQNIDSWGRDFSPKQRFADLLDSVGKVPGLLRVRFLTSHPRYMSSRVAAVVAAGSVTLMPNFNVPFQSGSNRVLKNMRRGYTRERYLGIVRMIRETVPDASITADCIVGFPGETESDFEETLALMEEVQFDVVNTAAYSARPHTVAADWENESVADDNRQNIAKVEESVKQARLRRINALAETHALARSRRFLGRILPVLVEDVSLKNPKLCMGRIPHSRLCYFEGDISCLRGKVVNVQIIEARAYSLEGRVVLE